MQIIWFVVSKLNLNKSSTILPLPLTKMHGTIEHKTVGNFNHPFSVLRSQ